MPAPCPREGMYRCEISGGRTVRCEAAALAFGAWVSPPLSSCGMISGTHQGLDLRARQWTAQVRQRPAAFERDRGIVVNVVHQEYTFAQTGQNLLRSCSIEFLAAFARRAFESFDEPLLVALGLQAADEPRSCVRQTFVVEIHWILRRQHDADTKGARLFQQRKQRPFRGRIRYWREVSEDLIHVEDGAETGRPRLRRVQLSISFSTRVTKNIRSESVR